MPVLPEVASSENLVSAEAGRSAHGRAATMLDAARSLTLPPGFIHSALPRSWMPGRCAESLSLVWVILEKMLDGVEEEADDTLSREGTDAALDIRLLDRPLLPEVMLKGTDCVDARVGGMVGREGAPTLSERVSRGGKKDSAGNDRGEGTAVTVGRYLDLGERL